MLAIFLEVYHQLVYILQMSNITENICIIEILCEVFILCEVYIEKNKYSLCCEPTKCAEYIIKRNENNQQKKIIMLLVRE